MECGRRHEANVECRVMSGATATATGETSNAEEREGAGGGDGAGIGLEAEVYRVLRKAVLVVPKSAA